MAAEASKAKHNHHNYSYFIHRTTVDVHMSPWLSAGTHSPHTPLQPKVVYASADAARSSGAHAHAELPRLPSILRTCDGARVVVVFGASVVVILGASGAVVVVVVVVVVGGFVVVVVVVVGGFVVVVVVVVGGFVVVVVVVVGGFVVVVVVVFSFFSPLAVTHTDGQQHRASNSRAYSRRHVIIVSVVVHWCGAYLHSEGHGEQQGRREVRQTHTQRAHHMRRGQQPGVHRTPHTTHDTHSNPRQQVHTHTDGRGRSKQERHTRLHRMHIRRERSVVSAPLTEGTQTHKNRCSAHSNPKGQSNNKKGKISPHTTRIVGPREVQPIFITRRSWFPLAVSLQHTPIHASVATNAAVAAYVTRRSKRGEFLWRPAVLPLVAAVVAVPFSLLVIDVFVNSSGCLAESNVKKQLFPWQSVDAFPVSSMSVLAGGVGRSLGSTRR
ncbi:hypothetical protein ECC02_012511 [Trypanosoma cruzi]|uniref:Uncharacterized protein n=1 Tax=Trypanosoma cruzi TaxID=5693 RepID=A0A7J6XK54_TRYCR|nr:hypothetical protein ECC02_012511 [Trypanosoma cruzi]